MISLILTLFISVFSIGSANYRLVVQKENTNILEISENINTKSLGFIESDSGTKLFMFNSDIATDNFLTTFVTNVSKTYPNMGFYSYQTANITFNNLFSYFLQVQNGVVKGSAYMTADTLTLDKHSVTYGGDYWILNYYLSFYRNSVEVLTYDYTVSVPLYEWNTIATASYSVTKVTTPVIYSSLQSYDWCYYEDGTSDATCPFIEYFLPSITESDYSYQFGYRDGEAVGYQTGYAQGVEDMSDNSNVANTIFMGIFDVGLLPVNVFLTIFNFELFGVNISGIVSGILTLSVVIIILRFILGGKKDD